MTFILFYKVAHESDDFLKKQLPLGELGFHETNYLENIDKDNLQKTFLNYFKPF